jgi:hypothetical protein
MAHSSARFRNLFIFRSARVQVSASDPENWATPPVMRPSRPTMRDALRRERVQVSQHGLGSAGELGGGQVAGPGEVVDLVVTLGQEACCLQPPEDAAVAVGAGQQDVFAGCQGHRAARAADLAGELDAGSWGADDENPAVGELSWVAVGKRGERRELRWDGIGDGRIAGRVHAPVASTTAGARRRSSLAWISKPCGTARTVRTVVPVRTGALT